MLNLRKMLTLAAAAAAIGMVSIPVTTSDAEAGWKGKHYRHFHGHRWHSHRFHRRHFYAYRFRHNCYWTQTRFGYVKVCPGTIYN
jgi:hypothetical protein